MNSNTALDYVKLAAIVVGGYYVVKTISSVGSGVSEVFSEPEIEEGTSQLDCDNIGDLSHQPFVYKVAADQIQNAIWNAPFAAWENDQDIFDALVIAWNLNDVRQLSCEYGVRGANDAISNTYNLAQSVREFLDRDLRDQVNNIYAQRGIDFSW